MRVRWLREVADECVRCVGDPFRAFSNVIPIARTELCDWPIGNRYGRGIRHDEKTAPSVLCIKCRLSDTRLPSQTAGKPGDRL